MRPLVSVVINNYNKREYIRECLQSVVDQTYKNWEIIFWDDNSTDGSVAEAWEFRKTVLKATMEYGDDLYKKMRVFQTYRAFLYDEVNVPLGVTRWAAVQNCKGKYIAFLDSDDFWYKDKLELQVKIMEEQYDNNVKLVFSNCTYYGEDKTFFDKYPPPKEGDPFIHLLTKYNFIPMSTVLVDREALLEVMGQSSHYTSGEDYDWWLKMTCKYGIAYLDQVLTYYRIVSDSLNHGRKQRIRAQWYEIDAFREALNYRVLTSMEKMKAYSHLVRLYAELIYKEVIEKL